MCGVNKGDNVVYISQCYVRIGTFECCLFTFPIPMTELSLAYTRHPFYHQAASLAILLVFCLYLPVSHSFFYDRCYIFFSPYEASLFVTLKNTNIHLSP